MKLYTSLLLPNTHLRQVQADLRNLYELHRTLSRAFPELSKPLEGDAKSQLLADEERKEVRCLFRVEESKNLGLVILVQSKVAPNWESVTAEHPQYLRGTPQLKEWEPGIAVEARLRFRLRANPTVKRDGKRLPLRSNEEQLTWLGKQSQNHGFELLAKEFRRGDGQTVLLPFAEVKEGEVQRMRRSQSNLTHHAVEYDGILKVTDADAFAKALAGGIGPAKGFGFGLLSVARLS